MPEGRESPGRRPRENNAPMGEKSRAAGPRKNNARRAKRNISKSDTVQSKLDIAPPGCGGISREVFACSARLARGLELHWTGVRCFYI